MAPAIRSSQQPASSPAVASSAISATQLPTYEAPIGPLNAEHIRKLKSILQEYSSTDIVSSLKEAADLLSASAADINERVYDKTKRNRVRQEHRRNKRAKRRQGDQNGSQETRDQDGAESDEEGRQLNDQEDEELEQLKAKVNAMTPRMDAGVRKVIDHLAGIEFLRNGVQDLQRIANDAAVQPAAPLSTQLSTATRNTSNRDDDGGGGGGSQINADTQITQAASVDLSSTPALPRLPQIFQEKVRASRDRYAALPSRARYGGSDIYTGFRRGVWDSQYPPDQAPPMPKSNTWFREEERANAPAPGVTRVSHAAHDDEEEDEDDDDDDDDDDDIEVALVQTSTTCPLTLQEFKDPLTSTKCPHSFERSAIETLLAGVRPPDVPGRRGRQTAAPPPGWKPAVRCPVGGCENMLARADLVHDAALVRRIQRIQRARQVDPYDAGDGDGDGVPAGAARGPRPGIGSKIQAVDEIESSDADMSGDDIDAINNNDGANDAHDGVDTARSGKRAKRERERRSSTARNKPRGASTTTTTTTTTTGTTGTTTNHDEDEDSGAAEDESDDEEEDEEDEIMDDDE